MRVCCPRGPRWHLVIDARANVSDGTRDALGEASHLGRDQGEAATSFTGAGSFNICIQGQ